jgi:nucleotide-binding universal stress UspA family protein
MIQLRRILVATDLSDTSERVYSYAEALARCFGAEFHVVHVRESDQPTSIGALQVEAFSAAEIARQRSLAPELASSVHSGGTIDGASVSETLVSYARAHEIDLIVMGGRGPSGLRMPRLGRAARYVVNHAPCPVLTVRHAFPTHGLRRILVPVDFSEPSRRTLGLAKQMAAQFRSQIDLLCVLEDARSPTAFSTAATTHLHPVIGSEGETRLRAFWEGVEGPKVQYETYVRTGAPAPAIINHSLERNCDLILIATHGRTGRRGTPMGSVAERVVNNALCATLTVRSYSPLSKADGAKLERRSRTLA